MTGRVRSLIVRAIGRPFGFVVGHLLRLSGRPIGAALMYHRIAERGGDPADELVPAHATRLFEGHLRHLRATYRLVPASQLLDAVARRPRGGRIPVAVTFDDDVPCHRTDALPVLSRLGTPATFFLSGASLDSPFSFWWERLQRSADRGASLEPEQSETIHEIAARIEGLDPPSRDALAERLLETAGPDPDDAGMRSEDVRTLAAAGLEIGFHTLRHHRLTGLDDDELRAAMVDGRDRLAELAGAPLDTISYPHGKADDRVSSAARAAGYRAGFTNGPGAMTADHDALLLPRLEPPFTSVGHFALQLARALMR